MMWPNVLLHPLHTYTFSISAASKPLPITGHAGPLQHQQRQLSGGTDCIVLTQQLLSRGVQVDGRVGDLSSVHSLSIRQGSRGLAGILLYACSNRTECDAALVKCLAELLQFANARDSKQLLITCAATSDAFRNTML